MMSSWFAVRKLLPLFVSRTLANQPIAPGQIAVRQVVQALLSGVDCAIYLIGSLVLIAVGSAVAARAAEQFKV